MLNTKFEAYKLSRELKRSGREFQFLRQATNLYNEPYGDKVVVASVLGLYHESKSNDTLVELVTGDTTQFRSKLTPMIMCLYESVKTSPLNIGDEVLISGLSHKVTGIMDVQKWGIIADISLEVIDSGVKAEI